MTDALSRRPKVSVNNIMSVPRESYREIHNSGLEICSHSEIGQYLGAMTYNRLCLIALLRRN